ncbi:MAG: hypothetical protein ACKOWE_06110 [Micrococcales bacterium]
MIEMSRKALATFALLFALNHAVLGAGWFSSYQAPFLTFMAFGIYLACVLPSILLYKGLVLPLPQAIANFLAAVAVPWLSLSQLDHEDISINGNYLTWFIGGVSTLLAITAVRSRLVWAWAGLAGLVAEVMLWAGFETSFSIHLIDLFTSVGVVGAISLVLAATAASIGLRNTRDKSLASSQLATETAAKTARLTAVQSERKNRVEAAIRAAQPVLQRIIDSSGRLSEADKYELMLTELALRDEIEGKGLLDDGVRIAIRDARRRGVEVTVVDAGGMDVANAETASSIRTSIARAIESATSGTVAVRAPKNESFMVSITAQRPEAHKPDLWLRLP